MILDNKNALHNALMDDVFDAQQDTTRCYYIAYCSISTAAINRTKEIISLILASESMITKIDESTMLSKILTSAASAEKGCSADNFTMMSNGRIAQFETIRHYEHYCINISVETLSNSEYYMQHREEFAETETN